ncbi:hypothetical protein CEXT_146141 [Caerostris extrusa]|uniref:Uncharacterized protein n=1 Tax=Caerostris extrusa TaxID=172846 RepID=A0AAV4XPT0_CAEEX|nr:hypothetical protein CEXT_146141 [Caerostris extrusa]
MPGCQRAPRTHAQSHPQGRRAAAVPLDSEELLWTSGAKGRSTHALRICDGVPNWRTSPKTKPSVSIGRKGKKSHYAGLEKGQIVGTWE